jgi:TatA/E family protein of Tat protein translocase
MFGGIGTWEILIILLVALLVFGGKQLPQVAKGIGRGLRDFQKATQDAKDEIQKIMDDEELNG